MKIYIGCGLTHVPRIFFEEHASFIHQLAAAMTADGHGVTYALVNSDPQLASKPFDQRARLCYLWDRDMVEAADLLIAEASFPSTGLGIEMQLAEAKGTPIVTCFRDFGINHIRSVTYENPDHTKHQLQVGEGFVTLMALGVPTTFKVVKYTNCNDGIAKIRDALELLSP